MRIVIAGSSGLLGTALRERLRERGDEVVCLVRREPLSRDESRWDPRQRLIDPSVIAAADAVVNLAGAGIADRPWTRRYMRELVLSRVGPTATLSRALRETSASGGDPRVLLSGSAIGYYGTQRGDTVLGEDAAPGADFLARLCVEWERAALGSGVRTIRLRTGNVLTNRGGFLGKQRLLYRMGLGGPIGSGQQWLSWITLEDHVSAMVWALENARESAAFNLVAPEPVRNSDFAHAYARSLNRPALVPFPRRPVAAVMGRQMVDSTIMAGQRVVPRGLLAAGFEFRHPDLDSAMEWLAAGA